MQRATFSVFTRGALVALATLIALAGCSNPFMVGLGDNVDIDRPDGDIRSPDAGNYLRATVTLTGSHSDDTTAVPTVTLSFNGAPPVAATVDENGWSYDLDTTTRADGELEVLITITDASGKSTEARRLYYVDNTPPLVLVKNPQGYLTNAYNGEVTVRGETADLFAIDLVRVQIQDDLGNALSGLDEADGTNSWVFTFDSRMYADPAGDLRIAVVATDRAGNTSTSLVHYDDVLSANGGQAITVENLRRVGSGESVAGAVIAQHDIESITMPVVPVAIDNDLDKPTVSFASPQNGQSVGGAVLVAGTAFDDDGVDRVEMRIDLNGDGDYDDLFDLNGDGQFNAPFEQESQWVTLSGTVLWTQDLNTDGELYQVEAGHNGQVRIQVRAVDIYGLAGNPVEISVRFDDTIPRVEGLKVDDRTFFSGISVSGTTTLTGSIRDDERVDRVRISYDGGISYTDIFNRNGSINDGSITENAPNDLALSKAIDTTNVPGLGSLSSDPLYVRLLVFDNNSPTPYQVISYVTLNVDNVYPTGSWNTIAADPEEIEGAAARVQGTAADAGTVSGIEEIHVYFVRGGQVYNLSNGTTEAAVTADFSDAGGAVAGFDYAPTTAHRIAIDNPLEFGDDLGGTGDGDGFDESLTISGSDYEWWAEFDSTLIPDGPIEVHYVILDKAGNGTHYQEAGFIKNNKPSITGLVVGTDVDYSAAVEADEIFPYVGIFSARSLLYIDVDATDPGPGGGIASYEIRRQDDDSLLTPDAGNFETGATINIAGWTAEEDSTVGFYALVTDTDDITSRQDFSIHIDNDDAAAPQITLSPLSSASVGSAGGHVESASESFFDNGTTNGDGTDDDADVSGTVDFTGIASDNQRIASITVQVPGFDAGSGVGAAHEIATWDAGAGLLQVVPGAGLVIDPQTLTTGGHSVGFTYTWDSSAIASVAGTNIPITFAVQDFRPGSPPAVSAGITVDVVPYVTSVSTKASAVKDLIVRSTTGEYSVPQGVASVIDVFGYNLAPGPGDVFISTDAAGTAGIDALTVRAANDASAAFAVDGDAGTSGYLQVRTNGILAINNTNDDTLTQNQEHSLFMNNRLWTDNRFVRFFEVNDTGLADAYYSTMIMDGDVPEYVYVDDSAAGDQLYRRGMGDGSADTGLLRGLGFVQSGFARDDGGHSYQVTQHDMTQGSMVFIFDDYTDGAGNGATQPFWTWYDDAGLDYDRYNDNNALRFETLALGGTEKMNRYQRPKIVVDGNADTTANVAMAWYDVQEGRIYARNFQIGTTVANQQRRLAGAFRTNMPENNDTAMDARRWAITDPGAGTPEGASTDFQIGFTDANVLVVVYYDESDGTLKLKYSTTTDNGTTPASLTGANPTTAIFFSNPVTLTPVYSGTYLSMDIATDGNAGTADPIHLAYYDSANADLKYTLLDSYADTTPQTVTVDANFSVGIWTDIAVDPSNGKPVISYYNNSENGTRDSIRLAAYTGGMTTIESGIDAFGDVTGSWEAYTVPTNSVPQGGIPEFQKTHIGFDTNGDIIVSYLGNNLEYVRMVD